MKRPEGQTEYRNQVFSFMREDGFSVRTSMQEAQRAIAKKFMTTSDDVRNSLRAAARACYTSGASVSQIDYLVSLAERAGVLNRFLGITTLTEKQASNFIGDLK